MKGRSPNLILIRGLQISASIRRNRNSIVKRRALRAAPYAVSGGVVRLRSVKAGPTGSDLNFQATGADVTNNNCHVCHSADRFDVGGLPRAVWKAEVEKTRNAARLVWLIP